MTGPIEETFSGRIVQVALSIPSGYVSTYGDIAAAAGGSGQAARSVNGILVRACRSGQEGIPFHRIVYSSGQAWLKEGYQGKRKKLLASEGIEINQEGYVVDFLSKRWEF